MDVGIVRRVFGNTFLRSKPACRRRPRRTAVCGRVLVDTRKPGRPTCGLRTTCRSVGEERLAQAWRFAARPGSPEVDLAGRGWDPTVVTRANVATLFPGCRRAAGPCRSQSRLDDKMGVKWPQKGAKWRLLREHATLLYRRNFFVAKWLR